jgi:hypothetical protein
MAKKIYRVVSWSLLALTLVSLLLALRKPSLPPVETSAEAAKAFDAKLNQLGEAHEQRIPREIRITEAELNSKLEESLQATPYGGSTNLKAATVRLEADRVAATFTVSVSGKDIAMTLGGNLAVSNGGLEFKPTEVKMGSLPVPLALVESTLRDRLTSPQARERMKLPEFIKDVKIENGELVLQGQ